VNDQTAGAVALLIFVVIFAFVGFWFGWSTILWILGAVAAMFDGFALFKRLLL